MTKPNNPRWKNSQSVKFPARCVSSSDREWNLQPANAGQLTGILIVNASILAGHFFALTCTRFTNIAFILLALLALAATAFNMSNLTPAANNLSPWSL